MTTPIDPFQAPFLELSELRCSDVGALSSCYIDEEMVDGLRQKFEAHLRSCSTCRDSVRQLRFVVDCASEIGKPPIPRAAQLRLREALEERVGFKSPKLPALRGES